MPSLPIGTGTYASDHSPVVHVGKPEKDRRGVLTYPVLVTSRSEKCSNKWIAIGSAWRRRSDKIAECSIVGYPSMEARLAVEAAVNHLMPECDRLMDLEEKNNEAITIYRLEIIHNQTEIEKRQQQIKTLKAYVEGMRLSNAEIW